MTQLDEKALEAAADAIWQVEASDLGNLTALMRRGVIAYLAALPAPTGDVGALVTKLYEDGSSWAQDLFNQSADALTAQASRIDVAEARANLTGKALIESERRVDILTARLAEAVQEINRLMIQSGENGLAKEAAEARIAELERDQLKADLSIEIRAREAAEARIAECEREKKNLQAALTARAKTMSKARDNLINARDELEDEGDRVYFGSTNAADEFREVVDELDSWVWGDIMRDCALDDVYEVSRKAHFDLATATARASSAENRIAELEAQRDEARGQWMRAEKAEARNAALVGALLEYGVHLISCSTGMYERKPCDCGLYAVLSIKEDK